MSIQLTCEHEGCDETVGVKDYIRQDPYLEGDDWDDEPVALCPKHAPKEFPPPMNIPVKMNFSRWMEKFWYRTVCPQPDKPILGSMWLTQWLYNFTARRASYWHKKNCDKCRK